MMRRTRWSRNRVLFETDEVWKAHYTTIWRCWIGKTVKYLVLGPTADRKCQISVTVTSANSMALLSNYIQYSRLPLGSLDIYPPGTSRTTCLQVNMSDPKLAHTTRRVFLNQILGYSWLNAFAFSVLSSLLSSNRCYTYKMHLKIWDTTFRIL